MQHQLMINMFMQNSIAIMTTDGSEFKMIVLGFVARFDLPREVFGSQDAEGFAHGKWRGIMPGRVTEGAVVLLPWCSAIGFGRIFQAFQASWSHRFLWFIPQLAHETVILCYCQVPEDLWWVDAMFSFWQRVRSQGVGASQAMAIPWLCLVILPVASQMWPENAEATNTETRFMVFVLVQWGTQLLIWCHRRHFTFFLALGL